MGTVILGAGIIGCSTAFALSQSGNTPPESIHLVEAAPRVFASASGYAGGFVAKDWFSGATTALGALSFDLHRKLAEEHNGRDTWGYSGSTSINLIEGKRRSSGVDLDWLGADASRASSATTFSTDGTVEVGWLSKGEGGVLNVMSTAETTAQVDPLHLSMFLLDKCLQRGVHLHLSSKAVSLSRDADGCLSGVHIVSNTGAETDISCTRLIITAGAWSSQVFSTLFPTSVMKIPVRPYAGHSLVVRSPRWSKMQEEHGCHAIYLNDPSGFSPEIFSRLGGEIYVAGLNSSAMQLPALPTDARIDDRAIAQLRRVASRVLGAPGPHGEDDLEIERVGLCFRPVTPLGVPIIARIAEDRLGEVKSKGGSEGGVFVCAGHGPWGISLSLGTGHVLAELVEGRATSVDISGLGI